MIIDSALQKRLEQVARRQGRLQLWSKLAAWWLAVSVLGAAVIILERTGGWASSLASPLVGFLGLVGALVILAGKGQKNTEWRELALEIEKQYPVIEGRLLTAVQQASKAGSEPHYLQKRLVQETLETTRALDWAAAIPRRRMAVAQAAHWLGLLLFVMIVANLHLPGNHALFARVNESRIVITPGDTNIESGSSLIVLARFSGPLPAKVEMALGTPGELRRIPLIKSLADPIFGGSVSEVTSNLSYHVEYGAARTRDFHVTVFEYPRLERADVNLTFPEYTGQPVKRIEDTRRLSAVQGSRLDLALQFNKPVAAARLVMKNQESIPLQIQTNRATAALRQFPLEASASYDLQLVDAEGRTNKVPAQFVFDVLSNRPPELRLASPRGDQRPSPLEEISFDGTVWDDFGVEAYGLAYTLTGQPTKYIELGQRVPAKEKRPFHHLLRLEELGAQPDQFIAWFAWADDVGPDGKLRRTAGDLCFGEIRPFDEVFRESQGMESEAASSGQGNETDKLTELQKQIINATWRLQRQHGGVSKPGGSSGSQDAGSGQAPARPRGNSALSKPNSSLQSMESRETRRVVAGWHIYPDLSRQQMPAAVGEKGDVPGTRPDEPGKASSTDGKRNLVPSYKEDSGVVRDAQAQVLEKAKATAQRQQDPRGVALWEGATKEMERALADLKRAANSPTSLAEALAAEQAAYQALMKLQAHEYQVSRARNRSQSGGSRNEQMQRQLDELDLTQAEDRYETQRQAQNQQTGERREQLQVMNRLQELARRQQDLNQRLKELQTALQEARTDQERQEIQRRLKRLQEEEQQMLADVDELRQRMDRPENQSQMADERRQLEQTRNEIQRAAEAAAQGEASQALASGTRAQRQLQDLRDQMRKENSSQFAEDMRNMRAQARELERRQEAIQKKIGAENEAGPKTLSGSNEHQEAMTQLAQQKQQLTNLVERATQVSQQAENSEPLLSRQLYDTVRKFSQDSAKNIKELQDDLLNQRQMTRGIYDRLRDPAQPDGPKLMDLTSDLLRQDSLPQAKAAAERAQASITDLKKGVERAAQSVIGDDTEALRLAHQELDQLTEQLRREMEQVQGGERSTNLQASASAGTSGNRKPNASGSAQNSQAESSGQQSAAVPQEGVQRQPDANSAQAGSPGQNAREQAQSQQSSGADGAQRAEQASGQARQSGQRPDQATQQAGQNGQQPEQAGQAPQQAGQSGQRPGQATQQAGQNGQRPDQAGQSGQEGQQAGEAEANASGQQNRQVAQGARNGRNAQNGALPRPGVPRPAQVNPAASGAQANSWGGGSPADWNRLLDANAPWNSGPLTGNEFGPWSDRLRDVEEMVELPDLRNQVAVARDRARVMRQEFRREHKKPDWAVVRSQIIKPLVEVRDQIADELARRQSNEALVPIDRDPVPTRYSELVRRYYENLGKDK